MSLSIQHVSDTRIQIHISDTLENVRLNVRIGLSETGDQFLHLFSL